ncbi:UPF0057-domain-containing protein [Microstroma glucosiphilum]|uniref:UPF0057-domain-containing protein n=1 Tax=Pseudomicrostroma glucosiphilum TaxID=1684307 RepID=A0A316UKX5_9BASI|nr:UPF0057-domain-containing protein [Pseudomicrostroma glucosiphilum]PWN23885.1 UPF0057-domain-containing protein [Pseudomicrostroma glucosiphilum]
MPKQVSSNSDVLLYFLAIFVPPVPVFIKRGCSNAFWINIILWLLAWIPGVIHAWYIIAKNEDNRPGRYAQQGHVPPQGAPPAAGGGAYGPGYSQGPYHQGPPPPAHGHAGGYSQPAPGYGAKY